MSLITPAHFRRQVESDLNDTEIQHLIDGVEDEIVQGFGPHVTQVDELEEAQLATVLFLSRPASEITTVTETVADTETVLETDDFSLSADGWRIKRLSDGTNGRTVWGDTVVVAYVPEEENRKRENVLIAMLKMDIQFNGLDTEKVGDWQGSQKDYEKTRKQILGRLSRRMGIA